MLMCLLPSYHGYSGCQGNAGCHGDQRKLVAKHECLVMHECFAQNDKDINSVNNVNGLKLRLLTANNEIHPEAPRSNDGGMWWDGG